MALDPKQLAVAAAKIFVEGTHELGSKPTEEADLVALGWGDLKVRPVILQIQEPPGAVVLAMGMEVSGGEFARPMRDVSVGVGPTPEDAIKTALQAWANGPYSVLHDALSDKATQYLCKLTLTNNETGESTEWCVFQSALQLGGAEEAREPLLKRMQEKQLFQLLLENQGIPVLEAGKVHWMKLHAARDEGQAPMAESIFDSSLWPGGQAVLDKFQWPDVKGAQTFRQYWIFVED
jgi:hypothetical protein